MKNARKYIPGNSVTEVHGNAIVFEVTTSEIIKVALGLRNEKKLSLKLITATDERENHGCFKLWYVFGSPRENIFIVPFVQLKNTQEFPSLSPGAHEAWNYEKKLSTFFGLKPLGHPDPRPIILHENWPVDVFPLRKDFNWKTRPELAHGEYHFQKVDGEGIYEIPVGPIHAGIIEPGHFRFSVAGEEIILLEPRLGFTHKGCEKLFEQLPVSEKVRLSEKISGDSSFSHSLAFCQAVEQLSNIVVAKRARYLRVIYAELERLANHIGDIGAIMVDTGFNFGGSHGARLREMIMQINERLTGSRFLRGVNAIGGVTRNINAEEKIKIFLK
ncbi:MAG: NADH-quinone oxidoreductase subunit C [Chloroflexi bacterium]|nr:NADH-quinone oxidoreductase subunit C [Chloroflexota bacterium]